MKPGALKNALAMALVGFTLLTAVVAIQDGLRIPSPPRSIMRYDNHAVYVVEVSPRDLIAKAGLVAGDIIIAFNGKAFEHRLDMADFFRELHPGDEAVFTVKRQDTVIDLATRTWTNLHPTDIFRLGIPLLVILGLGTGVYFYRPQLPGIFVFLYSCCTGALFAGCSATGLAGRSPTGMLLSFAYFIVAMPGPTAGLHFFLLFPKYGRLQQRLMWVVPILYALQGGLGLQYWLPGVWEGFAPFTAGPRLVGIWTIAFLFSQFLCGILVAISLATTAFRPGPERLRRQAQVVIVGLILAHTLYLPRFEAVRRLFGLPEWDFFSLAMVATIIPLFVAAAIIFHRMFDINVLTQQRLVYGAASTVVALLFIGIMGAAGWALGRSTGLENPETMGWLAAATALVAVAVHPLRMLAHRGVDRFLYRKRYDYRPALTEITSRLAEILPADEAALYLRLQIDSLLGPTWFGIAVRREEGSGFEILGLNGRSAVENRELEFLSGLLETQRFPFAPGPTLWASPDRPALVAPMMGRDTVVGAILVGPRRIDVPYRLEDRDFLATLANVAATVFERARLLDERSRRERLALLGSASAALVHELKNPLAAVKSTALVLRRRLAADERSQELSDIITREIDRLQSNILNVLSYVRPRPSTAVTVELADLLHQLAQLIEADLRMAGLEITVTCSPDIPAVHGDPERLRQLFLNLLLNAREAMTAGGRVEVTASPWSDDRGVRLGVEVVVSDTGPGFSNEMLRRAFEPFVTTKRLGTGLGLANVRRIVEEHSGEVTLANRPEGGARITVRLPSRPRS